MRNAAGTSDRTPAAWWAARAAGPSAIGRDRSTREHRAYGRPPRLEIARIGVLQQVFCLRPLRRLVLGVHAVEQGRVLFETQGDGEAIGPMIESWRREGRGMTALGRRLAIGCTISLVMLIACCAKSRPAPVTPAPPLAASTPAPQRADVIDPVGDIPSDARIVMPPDLMNATAYLAAGTLTFDIHFAPGTADRSTTWVRIDLDIDRNAGTGTRERNGMGTDYSVLALANGRFASVQTGTPVPSAAGRVCASCVGTAPMTFTADTMQVVVPLSLLGLAEQPHLFFQIRAWPVVRQDSLVNVMDALPNDDVPPGAI